MIVNFKRTTRTNCLRRDNHLPHKVIVYLVAEAQVSTVSRRSLQERHQDDREVWSYQWLARLCTVNNGEEKVTTRKKQHLYLREKKNNLSTIMPPD